MRFFSVMTSFLAVASMASALDVCCEDEVLPNYTLVPRYDRDYTLTLTGEFLYWKFSDVGSQYLRTGVGINDVTGAEEAVVGTGTSYTARYNYDPGMRFALTAAFGDLNAFDISLKYTRFTPKGRGGFDRGKDLVSSADTLNWFFDQGIGTDLILNSNIETELNFNWLDLVAGYKIDMERHYFLHPFAGVTGYFGDGTLLNEVRFIQESPGPSDGNQSIANCSQKTSVWGVGPIVGLDTSWSFSKYISLLASFDFRTVFFVNSMKNEQEHEDLVTGEVIQILNIAYDVPRVGYVNDFKIGPKWDMWFSCNKYHLSVMAAWEWTNWVNGSMAFLTNTGVDTGLRLQAQGLTVSALFEF